METIFIGVCTDTYVVYQSVLEKKTYDFSNGSCGLNSKPIFINKDPF